MEHRIHIWKYNYVKNAKTQAYYNKYLWIIKTYLNPSNPPPLVHIPLLRHGLGKQLFGGWNEEQLQTGWTNA